MKTGYVYILTNYANTVLYTGVTAALKKRVYEHKEKLVEGFSSKYNICKLVFYEVCDDISEAIAREKNIKSGSRGRKIKLVESMNSEWRDLYNDL